MPSPMIAGRLAVLAAACALPLLLCGCPERTARAAPQPAPTPVSPSNETIMSVAPDTTALPPSGAPAAPPKVPLVTETAPLDLPAEKPAPVRPRRPTESAAKPDEEPAVRPQPPQIRPQISPDQLAKLRRYTQNDAATAESVLRQVGGKQLSADQQDKVEKIQSYLNQSRQDSADGDWQGAANLAEKARSTAQELLKSF